MPFLSLRSLRPLLLSLLRFVLPGVLFYSVLETFFRSFSFSFNSVFLLFLLAAASAYLVSGRHKLAIIPSVLFAAGSVTFLLGIGQGFLQRYFLLFASFLFVLIMIGLQRFFASSEDETRPERPRLLDSGFNLNQTVIMFSIFFLSSGLYGVYIITALPLWQLVLILLAGIYLASHYLIAINFQKSQQLGLHLDYCKNRAFNFYSFLSTLLMIELAWTLTYLPINHLTFGAIVLAVFFSYWNIIRKHLRSELTRQNLVSHAVFIAFAVTFILSTSRLYLS